MSVEITCGKCGKKITNMKMLKSIKDVMNPTMAVNAHHVDKNFLHPSFHLMFKKNDLQIKDLFLIFKKLILNDQLFI